MKTKLPARRCRLSEEMMRKMLLGFALALPMIGVVSTSAHAQATGSANLSSADFSIQFSAPATSVSTTVDVGNTSNDVSVTPTNSLGVLFPGSLATASHSGTTLITAVPGNSWDLSTISVGASVKALTGSNATAQASAILAQDILFTTVGGATNVSLNGQFFGPPSAAIAVASVDNTASQGASGAFGVDVVLLDSVGTILDSEVVLSDGVAVGGLTAPPFVNNPLSGVMLPTLSAGSYTLELQLTADATAVDTVPIPPIPTPEPGTLALLAAGLVGVGWLRRRRTIN